MLTIALTGMVAVTFWLLRNERRWSRGTATVLLALVSLLAFLSVTVYIVAPTQLFYPHFDKTTYETLKADQKVEELTVATDSGVLSGCNMAVFDYPGYGKSAGAPSEDTLKAAGLSGFDALCRVARFDGGAAQSAVLYDDLWKQLGTTAAATGADRDFWWGQPGTGTAAVVGVTVLLVLFG